VPSDPSAYGLREYALDIDAVRAALGSESVHVLGHSWGGGLALTYAAAFPEHVASLTLIDNLPPRSDVFAAGSARFQARIAELMAAGVVPNPIPAADGDDCTPMVLATLPAYFGDPAFPVPAEIRATHCNAHTLQSSYAASLRPLPVDGLPGGNLPQPARLLRERALISIRRWRSRLDKRWRLGRRSPPQE